MDGMGKEREEGLLIANINLLPWLGLPSLIIFPTYRHDAAFCFLDIGEIDVDGTAPRWDICITHLGLSLGSHDT